MAQSSNLRDPAARYARLLEVHAVMARLSREIGPALALQPVLASVLEAMHSLVDFRAGRVALRADNSLRVAATDQPDELDVVASEGTITGLVLRTGQSYVCHDANHDPNLDDASRALAAQFGIRSTLTVPLVVLGQVIGTIQVDSSEVDAFSVEDQVLLEGLATQVAGMIESARRYEAISELEVLKSDFIARVSHELRTPITIMSGFVSTLLAHHDSLSPEARQGMLERVDVATARLSALIDQLLTLTRLEAGVVASTPLDVELGEVFREVRRQSGQPEEVSFEGDLTTVRHTDPVLLVPALGLLVDNALKYAGSCVLRVTDDGVEVVDPGPGIPQAERERVFDRFTRANADTTVPGMGIGLPMAQTLLAAAGADLILGDRDDGPGTRMVVRFWG